jgi:hypothetical protein
LNNRIDSQGNDLTKNLTNTYDDYNTTDASDPSADGWKKRPFHPKSSAHAAIKDLLLNQIRQDGIPGVRPLDSAPPAPPPPPPPPPKQPPYNDHQPGTGKCNTLVLESWDCGPDTSNLYITMEVYDTTGQTLIGHADKIECGANHPLRLKSKLENELVVTPEHGDNTFGHVAFQLGDVNWTSDDQDHSANAYCDTGGWDPRSGPGCEVNPKGVSVSEAVSEFKFRSINANICVPCRREECNAGFHA